MEQDGQTLIAIMVTSLTSSRIYHNLYANSELFLTEILNFNFTVQVGESMVVT